MPDYTDIPGVRVEVADGGTRITPPQVGPKVTVLGVTDSVDVPLEDPTILGRAEDIYDYDKVAGGPSEISKKIREVWGGGGKIVEAYVLSDGSGVRYSEDTITPSQRFSLMTRAYELLLNHDVDIILACGSPIDMTGLASAESFGYQMANFCYQATKEYNACVGVLGVQPPTQAVAGTGIPSLAVQDAHVTALRAFNTGTGGLLGIDFGVYDGITDVSADGVPDKFAFWATTDEVIPTGSPPASASNIRKDAKKNPIDIGAYISVVANWVRYRNESGSRLYPDRGYYNGPGDGVYAGMMSILPPEESTTNQIVSGCEPLRDYSPRQVNRLSGARFVSFWTQPHGFVVASGMTGAYNISETYRSDFVRLTTVQITHEVISAVRVVASPFIGKPNNTTNRSALEAAIDEGLGKLQERGALEGFRFSLVSTPTMRVLGQIIVDLTIVPAFEIQEIRVRVGLSAA